MLRALLLLTLLSSLAACSSTPSGEPIGTAIPREMITFSSTAAGPVTPGLAYSESALGSALPDFEIRPVTIAQESRTLDTLAAFRDGIQVMQLIRARDGTVGAVHGVDFSIMGPNGEMIGDTFADRRIRASQCRVGQNLWRGMAICRADGVQNVELVFAVPEYLGPYDRLPPKDQLKDATLQRIVWYSVL